MRCSRDPESDGHAWEAALDPLAARQRRHDPFAARLAPLSRDYWNAFCLAVAVPVRRDRADLVSPSPASLTTARRRLSRQFWRRF